MKPFRTEISIAPTGYKINYSDKILLAGSCFTDNIGEVLSNYKFNCLINPNGILYNPESIALMLENLINNSGYKAEEFIHHNELWLSLMHHGCFSSASKDELIKNTSETFSEANSFLKQAKVLIITWGTAWIYKYKQSGKTVSNCHKLPPDLFARERLSIDNIISSYQNILTLLKILNPNIKIIFTISPVRHLKDGFEENQLSKSILIHAAHDLVSNFENADYFPSYEIMHDDLRDYRFYADDMVHPNKLATQYIWEKFSDAFFSKDTLSIIKKIEKVKKFVEHKPFRFESEAYQKSLYDTLEKIAEIQKAFPQINFSQEIDTLKERIRL
ncbi:MAG: hypothetical protein C0594_03165 [Marinilabiliales bacterium]|nr:MAG: hypothetical protein C0594_03165 [Marinilabiliales bacterium]